MSKRTKIPRIAAALIVLLSFWWLISDMWFPIWNVAMFASGYLVGWYMADVWYEDAQERD